MYFKLNSFRLRVGLLVLVVIVFWTSFRFYNFREPLPLTRIELAEDGLSTVVTLLPVLVEVYYEALCPDSRSFFLTELLPTYEKIPEAMNVQLVPYGKAKTISTGGARGTYEFECQHGPPECLANKVHACSLSMISNAATRLKYVSCMINDNWNAEDAGSGCAKKLNIEWEPIWKCAHGSEGGKLLSMSGKKTDKIGSISFVPTIALQGSTNKQPAILKNLLKEICSLYKDTKPEGCPKISSN